MEIPMYRCQLVRDSGAAVERTKIARPVEAVDVARTLIGDFDREAILAIFLNQRNEVIGAQIVSLGTLDSALAEPREIFKAAILASAATVILAHNHPSGDPGPSEDDRAMTRRTIAAGLLLGIELLDHLVIGDGNRFTSIREEGKVDWLAAHAYLRQLRQP